MILNWQTESARCVTDANSPKADAWRQANPVPLDFTGFHRLELRNALGLAVFQQRLTPAESLAAWQEVEQDLAAGLLVAKADLWGKLVQEAERLAEQHTPAIGKGSQSRDIRRAQQHWQQFTNHASKKLPG